METKKQVLAVGGKPTETSPAVHIKDLRKVFIISRQEAGTRTALQGLVKRRNLEIPAIDGISFNLASGEIVGFLGPNGAGKATTLKMLSGLLHPSAGEVTVLGHIPWNPVLRVHWRYLWRENSRTSPKFPIHSELGVMGKAS